jgi:hypothetical protein
MGEKWAIALLLSNLGNVARHRGSYDQATALYLESLILYRSMDTKPDASECLEGLACVAYEQGRSSHAAKLLGAATRLRETIGVPVAPVARSEYERTVTLVRESADEQAFAIVWSDGCSMSLEQVLSFAGGSSE